MSAETPLSARSQAILDRLAEFCAADAPTHGGRVLSYVYDSGLAELDELAAQAMRAMQPVNGLDPTTFPSVAAMEAEVLGFARAMLHGDDQVVGSVTSGGTESCLLAVKTARDLWRAAGGEGVPRMLAPATVHAAFHKAAHYFGVELELVPVSAEALPDPADFAARLGPDVALVIVSAPAYPHASLDPIEAVAALAAEAGIPCHVDACIGGWVLPWWGSDVPAWDFAVPGVTSISADLHKFGYAPKGVSVLLHRGRERHRAQYFATTAWPGYPVVNPTLLGSKPGAPLAAAWAIIQYLGQDGFAELAQSCRRATETLIAAIEGIEGLRVVGSPVGPLLAVAADESVPAERRVDPHHWADRVRAHGWQLQQQPGRSQAGGPALPHTTHLTVTPVTEGVLPELVGVLRRAAEEVRGVPTITAEQALAALPPEAGALLGGQLSPDAAAELLAGLGLGAADGGGALPAQMAPIMALMSALPAPLIETLLVELLARLVEPRSA